jgi:hypothetical protein
MPIRNYLVYLFLLSLLLVLGSCQQEEETPAAGFILTQAQLDAAVLVYRSTDLNITGAPFGNRQNDSTRFLIRDIYSNVPAGKPLAAGSLVAIRAYKKAPGGRGKLKLIDVMVKQPAGYNANGGDFEYLRIHYDPATDYKQHPNGLLPEVSQVNARGRDLVVSPESCVSCHRKAGHRSFIFSRDFP